MPTTTRLAVTLFFVACGFVLLFLTEEKGSGVGLILAAAASLGIGSPPPDQRSRPAGPAGRQSSGGASTGDAG